MYFRQNKKGGTFRLVQFQSSDEAEQLYGALMRCRHPNLAHVLQFTVFLWDFDLSKAKLDIVSSLRDRSLALGTRQQQRASGLRRTTNRAAVTPSLTRHPHLRGIKEEE
ncbi:hypothetical protein LOK49_LG12G00522 [Camellia lanceoleosa]|uniref:Uncharacterized protein n=1 Tax=Camellia lanceoleosa TaxID=1840588 RepID=A0ACC0FVN5_9ERIC|nr:hypothetical protein LOK49_LG12G00522 [Camellia lanceoleosa]